MFIVAVLAFVLSALGLGLLVVLSLGRRSITTIRQPQSGGALFRSHLEAEYLGGSPNGAPAVPPTGPERLPSRAEIAREAAVRRRRFEGMRRIVEKAKAGFEGKRQDVEGAPQHVEDLKQIVEVPR